MVKQQKRGNQALRNNAPEQQKKEQGARREQPTQADAVIYINN
jgi:hypothetical protein